MKVNPVCELPYVVKSPIVCPQAGVQLVLSALTLKVINDFELSTGVLRVAVPVVAPLAIVVVPFCTVTFPEAEARGTKKEK